VSVVRAENLGKCFRIYGHPGHRLLEWASLGRLKKHSTFWAVRGVSFSLAKGECMGVIGANGSGKSTLLKTITGAMQPTEGSASVRGRVLSMIELGAGLNPDLTGRQNILNMARLLTLGADYASSQMEEIKAFADVGAFFDRLVRVYSSGMRVRLTFAMFACFKPDVLIVDEALSVGDVFFQQKCAARIRELLKGGMTMLFVSHDTAAVLNLCDCALLLRGGEPAFLGDPKEAVSRYYTGRAGPSEVTPPAKWRHEVAPANPQIGTTAEQILARNVMGDRRQRSHGHKGISIVGARVTDVSGNDTQTFRVGERMVVYVLLSASRDVEHPRAGLRLFDRLDNQIFGGGSAQVSKHLPPLLSGERLIVRFELTLDIRPGPYSFGLGTSEPDHSEGPNGALFHDSIDALGPIDVAPPDNGRLPFFGMANLPLDVAHAKIERPTTGARRGDA